VLGAADLAPTRPPDHDIEPPRVRRHRGCAGNAIPAAVDIVFRRIFASTGWSGHGAWWISVR